MKARVTEKDVWDNGLNQKYGDGWDCVKYVDWREMYSTFKVDLWEWGVTDLTLGCNTQCVWLGGSDYRYHRCRSSSLQWHRGRLALDGDKFRHDMKFTGNTRNAPKNFTAQVSKLLSSAGHII